jgi:DNA/RNA non-specific endonuclease
MILTKRILLPLLLLVGITSCKKKSGEVTPPTVIEDNDPILLGNPTGDVTNAVYTLNYLKNSNFYKIGYNASGTLVNTVDAGRVTVPKNIWKVILVTPKGNGDLERLDNTATVLSVKMPNDNRLYSTGAAGREAWRNYLTTVTNLETVINASGDCFLDLFKSLPATTRSYSKGKLYQ